MKTFLKKSLVLLAIIFSMSVIFTINTTPSVMAEMEFIDIDDGGEIPHTDNIPVNTGPSCRNFLGLSSWDCGLDGNWQGNDKLKENIWIIVTNISNDIVVIAAYLVLGYVIYGGYLYLLANGDTTKVTAGKKTLIHAFTGLAIVMLAKIIVGTIHLALFNSKGAFGGEECLNDECITGTDLVGNLIEWVIGISGLVAAAFVVIGAIGYITSSGDSSKLQKAKNTILYAIIGLAIVGLAQVITAVVTSAIKDSTKNTSHDTTLIIAKELTHEK